MKIEISNGDMVDKITILAIKISNMTDNEKVKNVRKEHDHLVGFLDKIGIEDTSQLYVDLLFINKQLWDIEDAIREKEKKKEFDEEFIHLARRVYITNDRRCDIKRKINIETNSNFIEEKSYEEYE